MRRLRIAVLEPIAHAGGAEISMLELVRNLGGDPQFVLILPEDGPLRAKALAAGAEVRILQWPARLMKAGERSGKSAVTKVVGAMLGGLALPRLAVRLAHLLDELRADILVTNGIKAHILGAVAQLAARRPLLWYLRDSMEGRVLSSAAMRLLGRRCDGAIAISHFIANESRRVLPASVPVRVIYNLVDFTKFTLLPHPPKDMAKLPGEIWFGNVGALTPLKGQDIFLQAAARIAADLPAARFVIVGGNFYRTDAASNFERSLRDLADTPKLRGRVIFLGQRPDIAAIFGLLDVLVQSNRQPEALGRTILEAMACGVSVIAVDRWGPGELVRSGHTGLTTPVLDIPALAAAMLRLGREPQTRAVLSATAGQWVRQQLEPDRIVGEFRGVLSQILTSTTPSL